MNTYNHCQTRGEKGVARKLTKFVEKGEPFINFKSFHNEEVNQTLIISHTLAIPTVLHSSENWTLKEQYKSRVTETNVKFLRNSAEYTPLTTTEVKVF